MGHTHIHTYIHTYIYTYIYTVYAYTLHTNKILIHTCIYTYTHTYMHGIKAEHTTVHEFFEIENALFDFSGLA